MTTNSTIFAGEGSKLKFLIRCSIPFSYRNRFSILIGSFLSSVRHAETLRIVPSRSVPRALCRDWPIASPKIASVMTKIRTDRGLNIIN